MKKLFVAALLVVPLFGCSGGVDDIQAQMKAIRDKPRGRIEPPPEFVPMPSFAYSAHQLRSPFAPPQTAEQAAMAMGKKVDPDFSRPPEYLERFSLEGLRFKGGIGWSQKSSAPKYALIEDPNGAVQRVKVGNYVGKNQGKIVEITDTQITLLEVVPDGRDGWVERPRTMVVSQ